MLLKYREMKEAVFNSYKSLYDKFHYTPKDVVFATIGEYDFYKNFSQIDEIIIFINFALIFFENQNNFNFIREKLIELVKEEHLEYYKKELKEEFGEFICYVTKVKEILQ